MISVHYQLLIKKSRVRVRDLLIHILRNPIQTLNWKPYYIHKQPGADPGRLCVYCLSLLDRIDLGGLLSLVFSIHSDTYTLPASSSAGSLSPEDLLETACLRLSVLRCLALS